jgi:predicted nucleic acid-binding protein
MRVVLDSCVAVKWELTEIDSDRATRLRDDARVGLREFIAPDVFPAEFAHAVTRAERQGRITPAEGAIAVTSMLIELPVLYPTAGLLPRASPSRRRLGSASTTACTSPWPSGRGATS